MKLIFALTTLIAMTACTPLHSGDPGTFVEASTGVVSQESLSSYESTVYAFGQTQGCVKCHGQNVNPLWMNSDVRTAYSFARPLIDFTNPTISTFALHAGDNHCGDPVCADPANISVMQDLLYQWSTVELNQADTPTGVGGSTLANPPFVTATMPIPASLPLITSGTAAVIRFDLSNLTPPVPALAGAILEVSIQSYNSANTTYKIFNPRLAGNSGTVQITSLHVYVRPAAGTGIGTEDANQGVAWDSLSTTSVPLALPSPMPAGPMTNVPRLTNTSLGAGVQSASDVITLGFESIQ